MTRFKFQLQAALDWRTQRLAAEQARLDHLVDQAQSIRTQLRETDERLEAARSQTLSGASIDSLELRSLDAFHRATRLEKRKLQRVALDIAEAIERQRKVLVEASRQCRLLEKLKERKQSEWRHQVDKAVDEEASELFLAKWTRDP